MTDLTILEHSGSDYKPMVTTDRWIVAYITPAPRFTESGMTFIERHMETDEVFILTKGSATLIMGKEMRKVPMEEGKMYCVSKGAWHNILVEEGSLVVVIENSDTTEENSEYLNI